MSKHAPRWLLLKVKCTIAIQTYETRGVHVEMNDYFRLEDPEQFMPQEPLILFDRMKGW